MQYLEKLDDLNPENTSFVLINNSQGIGFFAYNGKTASNTKGSNETNANLRGKFLRKGFAEALERIDEKVITPLYCDSTGKPCEAPTSKDETIDLIRANKLNIVGFKYNPEATQEQKDREFSKVLTYFVSASENKDFSNKSNLFYISNNGKSKSVGFNNEGDKEANLTEIRSKLGLMKPTAGRVLGVSAEKRELA